MVNQPAPVQSQLPPDFGNQFAQWLQSIGATDPGTAAAIAERALTSNTGFQLDAALNAVGAQQRADEFNASNQLSVDQFNAANEMRAAEANQAARMRVAEQNAALRAQQAQFMEQVRQFEIQDARERKNMRFLLRKEQVAVEEGNRNSRQNAIALQEQIASRLENNRFQRQQLVTEVQTINVQMENNVRVFNAQEAARVEQLNEQRRQANLDRLQSVSTQIGELAQNPADVGKLAAFLRSGNPAAISSAIGRGENAITDESLLGLRGLLGVREGLQEGPTLATGNFIEAGQIEVPEFGDLGTVPGLDQLHQDVVFDPTGIARGANPAGPDGSGFEGVELPPEIEAAQIRTPQQVQAGAVGGVGPAGPPSGTGQVDSGFQASLNNPLRNFDEPSPATEAALGIATPQTFDEVNAQSDADRDALRAASIERAQITQRPADGSDVAPVMGITEIAEQMPDARIVEEFDNLPDFVKRATGFEQGGVAPPGMPVIVGDSSDGKENQELAMVDARGNLIVVPIADLPRAMKGGFFPANQHSSQQQKEPQPKGFMAPPTMPGAQPQQTLSVQPQAKPAAAVGQATGGAAASAGSQPVVSAPDTQAPAPPAPAPGMPAPQFGPVSPEVVKLFLTDVQRDALRRGGFTDPTQVSPLRVSAPGTSRFLQDLSASVAGTLGFGPRELFFEELQRIRPTAVRGGAPGRRTA